jgi:ribonucleoside-triphosphate reductase (formate)
MRMRGRLSRGRGRRAMRKVIKRDDTSAQYDPEKIRGAVTNANGRSCEMSDADIDEIVASVGENAEDGIHVEEIQNLVEKALMERGFYATAKQYILYRDMRTRNRENKSKLMRDIAKKLYATNVVNQNANLDEKSFGGRKGEASGELMKWFALENCMSKKSRDNHLNNEIYIHDLDSYALGEHNCLSIPFDKLLAEGFNTRQTDIRPANSVNTAFQLVAVIFQIQSLQQFGGVSATHLDWTMVPYVRKSFRKHFIDGVHYIDGEDFDISDETHIDADEYKSHEKAYAYAMDMTEKELRQAAEGMMHNLNTLQSRSGNQLPFSSINYGTCTLPEGRMVIKALLEASIKGVGKLHKTSIFPCGIFQYMRGVNDRPGTPNYDLYQLALQSTARRLYPNYANVDWSNNAGYDVSDPKTYFSTMGCRTANGSDINAEPGTNPQTKDGRGNLCPVTIIMPTLAMEAKEQAGDLVENFISLLDRKIHEAKDMLIERYEYMCKQSPDGARFMYENGTMLGYRPEEGIRGALRHGTLAIGQLGLAETLQILIGKNQLTEEGMALAKRIEALFRDRADEFKHEYSLNFGVYYSPAENLCYTAMTKFKARYGVIPNVSDREYFTNSMHVPVWEKVNAFEKIDCESQLTGYSNAGCITYVEADGSILHNIDALETVVNYAMAHDIPYFAVNVPNDTCLDCGYTGEFNDECPICHSKHIQQLRRVTGYLTGDYKSAFNKGKQAEVNDRVKHI